MLRRKSALQNLPKRDAERDISPSAGGNFCGAKFPAPSVPCERGLRALDRGKLFAEQKFPVALPPAAILRKGNARCALAKTLAKLTKAVALVYSLRAVRVSEQPSVCRKSHHKRWHICLKYDIIEAEKDRR